MLEKEKNYPGDRGIDQMKGLVFHEILIKYKY